MGLFKKRDKSDRIVRRNRVKFIYESTDEFYKLTASPKYNSFTEVSFCFWKEFDEKKGNILKNSDHLNDTINIITKYCYSEIDITITAATYETDLPHYVEADDIGPGQQVSWGELEKVLAPAIAKHELDRMYKTANGFVKHRRYSTKVLKETFSK